MDKINLLGKAEGNVTGPMAARALQNIRHSVLVTTNDGRQFLLMDAETSYWDANLTVQASKMFQCKDGHWEQIPKSLLTIPMSPSREAVRLADEFDDQGEIIKCRNTTEGFLALWYEAFSPRIAYIA